MKRAWWFCLGLILCAVASAPNAGYAEETLSERELWAGILLLEAHQRDAEGQWEQAKAAYQHVIELAPELFEPYYMLGLYHIGTDEGQRYFEQANERHPRIAEPYYWHGYVDYKNGHPERARPYLLKFVEVAEHDPREAADGRISTARKLLAALDQRLSFPYPETDP